MVGEQVLLRIHLDAGDRSPHTPAPDRLVRRALQERMAGATVIRGIAGFSPGHDLRPRPWAMVTHLPLVVEIVDSPERIAHFVDGPLSELILDGIVTLERAAVVRQGGVATGAEGTVIKAFSTLPAVQSRPNMTTHDDGVLVRMFISESDRFERRPLYEAVLGIARDHGLAGATVFRGQAGFGRRGTIHTAQLLDISTDLPLVIEIIDTAEKVASALVDLQTCAPQALITTEQVRVLSYAQAK